MKKALSTFRFRLMLAWNIMVCKKFIVNMRGDRTYMKNVSMNEAIEFHRELTIFLNTIIESTNAQEDALKEVNSILKGNI